MLAGFSESAEFTAKSTQVFTNGLWIPDPDAVDVLRGYMGVLDRLPDANGLVQWTHARHAGLDQPGLVTAFADSAEFQTRFGGLSNQDFVAQLYRTALDRAADADGLAAWSHVLDAGIDNRAGVALGFSSSAEMSIKLLPLITDGIAFA